MERRHLSGEIHALVSPTLEAHGVLAAFTERTGGSSSAPFTSLNLGRETGDDPSLVEDNTDQLRLALGVGRPVVAHQVHGSHIASVESAGGEPGSVGDADGMTTTARSIPLAVMVADCLPLALVAEHEGGLAAIHVGWRGLASGIVQRALDAFERPRGIVAAIGPSIGPCHYEVGPEVIEAVSGGTGGLALTGDDPLHLDLGGTVEAMLGELGVREVDRATECTACEPARFFSHRRDGRTGRQALIAVGL